MKKHLPTLFVLALFVTPLAGLLGRYALVGL